MVGVKAGTITKMPHCCFVPNCNPKKKVSFFRARNLETLEKWQYAIGRSDRDMTLSDQVCEQHFDKDNIVRYFEHKLKDGTLYRLARGRPCLKPGTVPTIISGCNISPKLEYLKNKENESNLDVGDSIIDCSSIDCSSIDCSIIDCSDQIVDDDYFSFKDIVDNIDKIKFPCISWTISNVVEIKKYIIATRWINLRPERWLVIDEDLNSKLIYRGREIDTIIFQRISSIDDVNNLLKTVHRYDFCLGVNDNDITSCSTILETSQLRGRKKKYCNDCFVIRRRKADRLRKSACKKTDPKLTLYTKLKNLRRQNSRLLDKVMRLRRKLNGENYVKEIHNPINQIMGLE